MVATPFHFAQRCHSADCFCESTPLRCDGCEEEGLPVNVHDNPIHVRTGGKNPPLNRTNEEAACKEAVNSIITFVTDHSNRIDAHLDLVSQYWRAHANNTPVKHIVHLPLQNMNQKRLLESARKVLSDASKAVQVSPAATIVLQGLVMPNNANAREPTKKERRILLRCATIVASRSLTTDQMSVDSEITSGEDMTGKELSAALHALDSWRAQRVDKTNRVRGPDKSWSHVEDAALVQQYAAAVRGEKQVHVMHS